MELINRILNNKIIVIIRDVYGETLYKTVEALHQGGIQMVEITFDQSLGENAIVETSKAIQMLTKSFPLMDIGAGTVLTEDQVVAAYDAGATYIISPNVDQRVIAKTKSLNLVSIPGAITPTEIVQADQFGADLVKIFPAKQLGSDYIKDVMAPLNHIKFLAAAGINKSNILEYMDVGYQAFGISGDLLRRDLIERGDFEGIRENAEAFLNIVRRVNTL